MASLIDLTALARSRAQAALLERIAADSMRRLEQFFHRALTERSDQPKRTHNQNKATNMDTEYKMTLSLKTLEDADPKAKAVLEKAKAQVGFIPNMYSGMANSPGLLETYLDGYERFRSESGFTPAEQEVVFLTISRANGCDYCMAAHSMIAEKKSKVPPEVTKAVRANKPLPDPKLAALSIFTTKMFMSRGLPTNSDVATFVAAGYTERHVLEIILAIAMKTLSNYSNHLFHTPLDTAFANWAWQEAE